MLYGPSVPSQFVTVTVPTSKVVAEIVTNMGEASHQRNVVFAVSAASAFDPLRTFRAPFKGQQLMMHSMHLFF